jgi:flavin-binding protein dodecin
VIALFARLIQRQSLNRIISTARQIANQSRDDVWARVRDLVFQMDIPEARGYVRARAAKIVRREAEAVVASTHGIDAASRHLVKRMATERVVQLVLAEVVSTRPSIRRAA